MAVAGLILLTSFANYAWGHCIELGCQVSLLGQQLGVRT